MNFNTLSRIKEFENENRSSEKLFYNPVMSDR